MEIIEYLESVNNRYVQVLLTVVLVLLYLLLSKIASRIVKKYGRKNQISLPRVVYTIKYIRFVLFSLSLLILGAIWDLSFKGLSVYFVTFFTVAGIGLFAAWSILSNITSAIILFFYFPFRIGDRIRIMDGDNSVEGIILDLKTFSMVIKNDDGNRVTYPNNLALQKGIIHL